MALNTRMTVTEAARALGRWLFDYATTLAAAAFVAAAALGAYSVLRTHEDHLIERLLEAEGRVVASEMTRAIETRMHAIKEFAHRFERVAEPAQAAWQADAAALAAADPVYRAFEWRDSELRPRWSAPLTATLPGAELDSTYESARIGALAPVLQQPAGLVSASFPGPGGRRQIIFAAPLMRDGARVGVISVVCRAPDLIKAIVEPATRRGFSVAVREGPYHVFGPLASKEGADSELWQHTVAVRAGELVWAVDYWPGGEVLDHLRSLGPPLVLLAGLFAALFAAVAVRALELGRRAARVAGAVDSARTASATVLDGEVAVGLPDDRP